jgi:hypothetical protein
MKLVNSEGRCNAGNGILYNRKSAQFRNFNWLSRLDWSISISSSLNTVILRLHADKQLHLIEHLTSTEHRFSSDLLHIHDHLSLLPLIPFNYKS